jgi:hypothetical protein
MKTTTLLSIDEENHCREASQFIASRKTHIVIHLDLGQQNPTLQLIDCSLQCRREGNTGGTPLRPEVDQDRLFMGCLNHVLLLASLINFDNLG